MSETRKQWLAQLMEKKRRAKERAEILAKDPHAFDHEKVDKKKNNKSSKKKGRGGGKGTRNKRGSGDMSASDYESDGPDSATKYRRTSKASKVDSSSEMSDTDSPRVSRRRGGRGGRRKGTDQDTSDELDNIFDDLNVGGSTSNSDATSSDASSGGVMYGMDPLHFLDDSHNIRRNQGRRSDGKIGRGGGRGDDNDGGGGRPMTAPTSSIFGSTNLDRSLSKSNGGISLDDSLKYWESTAMSAQQDLNSFVSDFSSPPQNRISTISPIGPVVVESLFDLGGDEEALEQSWMMATDKIKMEESTDPLAFSIGSVGSVSGGNSLGSSGMGRVTKHGNISPITNLATSEGDGNKMEQSLLTMSGLPSFLDQSL